MAIIICILFLVKPSIIFLNIAVDYKAILNAKEDEFVHEGKYLETNIKTRCQYLYKIKTLSLYGENATKNECLKGLKWVSKNAKKGDFALIYIGTHGSYKNNYSFYPANHAVTSKEIIEILKDIKSNLLLIVDTCNAEGMILDWKNHKPGIFILATSARDKKSYVWNFVRPFVNALENADYNEDHIVDMVELKTYISFHISKKQSIFTSSDFVRMPIAIPTFIFMPLYHRQKIKLKTFRIDAIIRRRRKKR